MTAANPNSVQKGNRFTCRGTGGIILAEARVEKYLKGGPPSLSEKLRDRWFWALVQVLLQTYDYEWIDNPLVKQQDTVFRNVNDVPLDQVWLIRNRGRHYELLRLQAVDGAWPSMIARDIRQLADRIPLFRKRLKARSLQVHNVYVFEDWLNPAVESALQEMQDIEDTRSSLTNRSVTVSPAMRLSGVHVEGMQGAPFLEQDPSLAPAVDEQNDLLATVERRMAANTTYELQEKAKFEGKRKEKAYRDIFHYGRPVLTFAFLAINIVMFIWIEMVGSSMDPSTLIEYGAKWNPAILEGEYWRLITPMFLHIGWVHLAFNSMALFFLGGAVERIFGSKRFLWMYFFAGFTGALASFAFTPNLSAGASGAIFGCFGALLYFGLKRRNLFFRTMGMDIIFILVFNLGIGFVVPMIDNYGHIGGLVGGFMAAAMVGLPKERHVVEKLLACGVSAVLVAIVFWVGTMQLFESPLSYVTQAEVALQADQMEEAEKLLHKALDAGFEEPEAFVQLGIIYVLTDRYAEAEHILLEAKDRGADQAEFYFQLSYAQLQQEKYSEAERNLEAALERNPELVEAYNNLVLIHLEKGDQEAARSVLEEARERGVEDEMLDELRSRLN
jgi:rhomboid protease GluP